MSRYMIKMRDFVIDDVKFCIYRVKVIQYLIPAAITALETNV